MLISIIIPCGAREDVSEGLISDIESQKTSFATEIIVIEGIKPAGRARNTGVARAKGDILIFMDSDIRLGSYSVLEKMAQAVISDDKIGIAASSVRLPEDANRFERIYAEQIPHCQSPLVSEVTDVWVATSACSAIKKGLFLKIGGFNEVLPRGQDPELSYRVRKAGYRTVLVPGCWFYHHQPRGLGESIRLNFRNGRSAAFVDIYYPDLNIDLNPKGIVYQSEVKGKKARIRRIFLTFAQAAVTFKFLLLIAKMAYAAGYFIGSAFKKKRDN